VREPEPQRRSGLLQSTFETRLRRASLSPFVSRGIETLQINVGKRCNLMCKHCHVEAGPLRVETMSRRSLETCLAIAAAPSITTLDITGGAPEMNPHLEWFLTAAARLGKRIIVRSNLTILLEKEYSRFIDVYTRNRVEIAASLPDCKAEKCDRQRGAGSFDRIISVMKRLNVAGYGRENSGLVLDLVHNPVGAFLPASQASLEREYKTRLAADCGVAFNRLFCITNNPLGRYRSYLVNTDNLNDYMKTLEQAFNPAAAQSVMCRSMLSVGWDGTLYDCDFNQVLELPLDAGVSSRLEDFDLHSLEKRRIVVADHCFACTAGQGSSCQGAVGAQGPIV
jgi:radical SAM/Cys-rich protein